MPGDLRNPEESREPFHYDSRYEQGTNMLEPKDLNLEGYLQTLASESLGRRLSKEEMGFLKDHMGHRLRENPGDERFIGAVKEFVGTLKMARRLAEKCLN